MKDFGTNYNYKYNSKELQETGMYDYGARFYMPDIGRWGVVDPLADVHPEMTPFRYSFNNPINFTDPTGLLEDWYNDSEGNVSWHDSQQDQITGSDGKTLNRLGKSGSYLNVNGGVTTLNENATVTEGGTTSLMLLPSQMSSAAMGGDAISSQGSSPIFASFDTSKTDLSLNNLPSPTLWDPSAAMFNAYLDYQTGKAALRGFGNILFYESAAIETIEPVVIHGNSLKSQRPTWGYKLYSEDGTFLKNGITSKENPIKRYTKSFMEDKKMVPVERFSNRKAAWEWEYNENQVNKGPWNKNNH